MYKEHVLYLPNLHSEKENSSIRIHYYGHSNWRCDFEEGKADSIVAATSNYDLVLFSRTGPWVINSLQC